MEGVENRPPSTGRELQSMQDGVELGRRSWRGREVLQKEDPESKNLPQGPVAGGERPGPPRGPCSPLLHKGILFGLHSRNFSRV